MSSAADRPPTTALPHAESSRAGEPTLTEGVLGLLRSLGDLSGRDDEVLESLLTDAERAVNMLRAAQADAMRQLEQNARAADATLPADIAYLSGRREEGVVDQIAIALTCTKVTAAHRYDCARSAGEMPAVRDAWRRGDLDERKVSIIGDALATALVLDDDGGVDEVETTRLREQLSAAAVVHAATYTAPQTRAWLGDV